MTKVPDAQPAVTDAQTTPVAPAVRPDPTIGPEQGPPASAPPSVLRARPSESTARFASQARVGGQHPRLRTSFFARLESRAGTARKLQTATIEEDDLSYLCAPRPPQTLGALPRSLLDMPVALVRSISDVLLVSERSSDADARVRLGELSGGRPVAVMSSTRSDAGEHLLAATRGLIMFDRIGIGPCFHGLVRKGDVVSAVMDIVPGDLVGTPVTERTFADLETIIVRLERARLQTLDDTRVHRTSSGRLMLIAGETVAERIGEEPRESPNAAQGSYTELRLGQLLAADDALRQTYLAELQASKPEAYAALCERL